MKITDLGLDEKTLGLVKHLISGKEDLELPDPKGYQILALQFVREAKTAGGIFLTAKTTDEDKWQGRVGLVLDRGALAYSDKDDVACDVGDWIIWGKLENSATRTAFGKPTDGDPATLVFINDDRVLATVSDPLVVIGK